MPENMNKMLANLRAVRNQLDHDLGRSAVDWATVEALQETSDDPQRFERLIDIAITELVAAKSFPWRTEGSA
jgi:hypothetical protein